MKKIVVVLLIIIIVLCSYIFIKKYNTKKNASSNTIRAGYTATDFTLGMKNERLFTLNDFVGTNTIILAFMSDNPNSIKLENLIKKRHKEVDANISNLLWFNIKIQNKSVTINEITDKTGLKYKLLERYFPEAYQFEKFPIIIVIDKNGIIKMIYDGYSPTFIQDIISGAQGL